MRLLVTAILFFLYAPTPAVQGQPRAISDYIALVESGKADSAKAALPQLLEQFPNNPGVLYLQALLTTDGGESVRLYQGIVDNFPASEWADDALYKVYQFYYALGLYRTAAMKMEQLKKEYPSSPHLKPAAASAQALPEEEQQPPAPPTEPTAPQVAPSDSSFALQVGAYSSQVNAEKQKLFFEDLNMPVEIINRVKDGRSLYIVLVGRYTSVDAARGEGRTIREKYNIDSMVITR